MNPWDDYDIADCYAKIEIEDDFDYLKAFSDDDVHGCAQAIVDDIEDRINQSFLTSAVGITAQSSSRPRWHTIPDDHE